MNMKLEQVTINTLAITEAARLLTLSTKSKSIKRLAVKVRNNWRKNAMSFEQILEVVA